MNDQRLWVCWTTLRSFLTFLCNSDKERKDLKVVQQTQSLWSFINSKQKSLFLNPMYCKPLDSRVALFPIASIRYMKFWKSYYCRWNPRMRPQDSVHLRHAQLLNLRDQLQAKVEVLNDELDKKNGGNQQQPPTRRAEQPLSTRFEALSINI